ncbi:MAG: site-specific DNA-methyltransferase [Bacteroidaceae bacterium]|nr:site-specific DNA-methyltransferase [Bacteroidaceae bacterium]
MLSVDKSKLAHKIRTLDGLTNEEKSSLLQLLYAHKKYGLVWEEKTEDVEEKLRNELPVLNEVKDRAIISEDDKAPNHIIIEGDNLEALTTLSYTHEGKIDVIYIDPPYNTGNKDFVYNDSYVDSDDSFRHSKWLSFMNKRLKIAKRLLSERGVIFISIDDNEQAQLKLLCDEIFGSKNFIAKFDWRKKTGANDAKDIAVITESILLFAKSRQECLERNIWNRDSGSRNNERFKLSDLFVEQRGRYYLDTLDRGGLQYSDSLNFGIKAPDGGIIYPNGRSEYINDGWIWKWSKDKIDWGLENGFLEFVKSSKSKGSKYTIKYKVYELVDNEGRKREKIGRAFSNLIVDPINQIGNIEITDMFEGLSPFSNPKPTGLLKYLLSTVNTKDSLILDFFAGSGTTLHATMQFNAEDGGHRQCILVTNNENNICEEVTYERNKRVIEGYTTPKGNHVEGLHNNNLRYYKTKLLPRERTQQNMRDLVNAATDLLCIKEDLYDEEVTFGRYKVHPKLMRYFSDGMRHMLIVYREEIVDQLAEEIATMDFGKERLKIFIFSPARYAFNDNFFEVQDKVELVALPAAIYDAYEKVLPMRKEKLLDLQEADDAVEPGQPVVMRDLFENHSEEGGEA